MQSQYDYEYEENVPKNCSTSESITGGTVEYFNGGAVGSLLIYHCSDGFEPYPISQKVCSSDGEWKPKVSRVKCEGSLIFKGLLHLRSVFIVPITIAGNMPVFGIFALQKLGMILVIETSFGVLN